MTDLAGRIGALTRSTLIDRVERDHRQSDAAFHRRRIVVALVLALGAALLGVSLAVEPGDTSFYLLTAALAATWVLGGLASGPLHLGRTPFRGALRRPVATPVLVGLAAGAVFVAGALVVRQLPPLRDYTESVLAHARFASLPLILLVTLANGAAEEVFFRGALFAAIGQRLPVLVSTVVYAVATLATGNPMLVFAAATLGIVLGLQRRASGGILGSILTHLTWSSVMLVVLPPLFAR